MIDWNPNNPHRASYSAHNRLYDMADEYFSGQFEVWACLRENNGKLRMDFNREKTDKWFAHSVCYFPLWTKKGHSTGELSGRCESWFQKNCDRLIQGFFNANGYKNIEGAIQNTDHFNDLTAKWDEWFERKRKSWMKKYEAEVMSKKGVPAKMPSSHGGVANLLKTLTKTMTLQGASIQSIAKVQYAVCTQAGIYIPNEFLTDVAVALDYNDQMDKLEKA